MLMMKRIFTIFFSAALLIGIPQVAKAETSIEIIDADFQPISISINEPYSPLRKICTMWQESG